MSPPPTTPGSVAVANPEQPVHKKKTNKKKRSIKRKRANALIIESEITIREARKHLEQVQALASKAGLSIQSELTVGTTLAGDATTTAAAATETPAKAPVFDTGGHSNTDHIVVRTGNPKYDRIAELKRSLLRRHRAMQPEHRGEDRWDRPKRIPGERRRKIVREKDFPEAPPEPPPSGYTTFVAQMGTKIRHDRPEEQHDQAKVIKEISKLWRIGMTESDREYYLNFSIQAKRDYQEQLVEYRATGQFTPSRHFIRLPESNVWIHREYWRRGNGLEREIASYDTIQFPKRPAHLDDAYQDREERGRLRRKLKIKGLINENGTLKNGLDFEELLREEQQKRRQLQQQPQQQSEEGVADPAKAADENAECDTVVEIVI